jgi:hypothetical protein
MDTSSGGSHTGGRAVPSTKVNRCMAEGRKAFAAIYGGAA